MYISEQSAYYNTAQFFAFLNSKLMFEKISVFDCMHLAVLETVRGSDSKICVRPLSISISVSLMNGLRITSCIYESGDVKQNKEVPQFAFLYCK